jgi:hypothetical protein
LLLVVETAANQKIPQSVILPNGTLFYMLLFFYAHITVSINFCRLVAYPKKPFSYFSLIDFSSFVRFITLSSLIEFTIILPGLLTNIAWLQLITAFFLLPLTLNYIHIALNQPIKWKWKLSWQMRFDLLFLQVILPLSLSLIILVTLKAIDMPSWLSWAFGLLIFYWRLLTLTLSYQLIHKTN